ncbi:uncharacterized protein LOC143710878 [Siphateles boraxobius]|uniref:uncharacterized protein LOC143710878 n=1 Tax=Siphateles boraxobius TaxID=180520 RepID=UPI0040640207
MTTSSKMQNKTANTAGQSGIQVTCKISASDDGHVFSPIITGLTLGSFEINMTSAKPNVPAYCKISASDDGHVFSPIITGSSSFEINMTSAKSNVPANYLIKAKYCPNGDTGKEEKQDNTRSSRVSESKHQSVG